MDITGRKFGRLMVLRRVESYIPNNTMWEVECDCGNRTQVMGSNLRGGNTKSCGCLHRESAAANGRKRILPENAAIAAARLSVLKGYQRNAFDKHLVWEISDAVFDALTRGDCHYCGSSPSNKECKRNGTFVYSGIDRQDNLKGYTAENCVSCCWICNDMKGELPGDVFLAHIRKILARRDSHV